MSRDLRDPLPHLSVSTRRGHTPLNVPATVTLHTTILGRTPLLANPFRLQSCGTHDSREEAWNTLYCDWLTTGDVTARALAGNSRVNGLLAHATGNMVLRLISRIHRINPIGTFFHLQCTDTCVYERCHRHHLHTLFHAVARHRTRRGRGGRGTARLIRPSGS